MKFLRFLSMGLLLFLGLGALVGAIPMILYPKNNQWGLMPLSLLQYSPFDSYLIPGFILLVSSGLLALWVFWLVLQQTPRHGLWTAFQGCVLLGWLTVECLLLRVVAWPHIMYGAVGLGLLICGLAMWRLGNREN